MTFVVRPARLADADWMPDIERSAGELFLTLPDLAWVASHDVSPPEEIRPLIRAGTVWVADDQVGEPVGFLLGEADAETLHILELAVALAFQRHGLGKRLIQAAEDQARRTGHKALTLTTFRTVPWNAPAYEKLGFEILPAGGAGAKLEAILAREDQRGLPDRVAMRKAL